MKQQKNLNYLIININNLYFIIKINEGYKDLHLNKNI